MTTKTTRKPSLEGRVPSGSAELGFSCVPKCRRKFDILFDFKRGGNSVDGVYLKYDTFFCYCTYRDAVASSRVSSKREMRADARLLF
jgi:hypothetical protein